MTVGLLPERASRLYARRNEALARGALDRADMLLRLHRVYVAAGLAALHEHMGSHETAEQLKAYAKELREGGGSQAAHPQRTGGECDQA